jgi:hypothetical protein
MKAVEKKKGPSKATSRELLLVSILIGITAPITAFAASGASENESGMFVWVFLGLLAMIVVAQVIPAILLMFGMVKGIKTVVKEEITSGKK